MNILLGGIPLGCDNIGDEAIIACVVRMLHESLPDVKLTVATADSMTGSLLGVNVVPPFGFLDVGFDGFSTVVRQHDAFVWAGATGLSDYPHIALTLLEMAQAENVPTFVWGVGMDDELNPVFFKVHGKKRLLLKCLGLVDWVERRRRSALAQRLKTVLPRCKGIWLRDPQSAEILASMGVTNVGIAADTAILLRPAASSHPSEEQRPYSAAASPVLGLCISAQRQVTDMEGVRELVKAVWSVGGKVLGIPMNPKTDRPLMEALEVPCITGTTPEAVLEAAAGCTVVLSSRLHLLILAANAGTPILGIARGSKLANWLANFNRTVLGSVTNCNWPQVTQQVLEAMKSSGDWEAVRAKAYAQLDARLDQSRREFIDKLRAVVPPAP